MVIPRSFSSGALSIESKERSSERPFFASTVVIAAVRVVLPWSTCPMVPTFTCGLDLSNFSFAMFEIYLGINCLTIVCCSVFSTVRRSAACILRPVLSGVGGDGFEPPKSKTADLQSAPFGHSGIRPYGGASLRRVLRLFPVSVPSESSETPVFREIPVSLQGFEDDKITHYLQIRKHYLPKSAVSGENYPLPPAEKVCKRAKSASKVQSIF